MASLKKLYENMNVFNEELAFSADEQRLWDTLKTIRSALLKATEELREKDIIKRSLDARVTFFIDPTAPYAQDIALFFDRLKKQKETPENFFKDFAILSQFVVAKNKEGLTASSMPGLFLNVEKAYGVKCPRCWQWTESSNEYGLCDRCAAIVGSCC